MVTIARPRGDTWSKWYTPEKLKLVEGWCRDGLTTEQIAHNMGITRPTLYRWRKDHPELEKAMAKGLEVTNVELENALFQKAIGAKTKTIIYKMVKLDNNVLQARRAEYAEKYASNHPEADKTEITLQAVINVPTYEKIAQTETENYLPPDVGALMFLLKNRLPEKYREKSYQELNKAQALKAKLEAEITKKQLEMLNDTSDPTNDQLNDLLDKLAEGVTEENTNDDKSENAETPNQETKSGS